MMAGRRKCDSSYLSSNPRAFLSLPYVIVLLLCCFSCSEAYAVGPQPRRTASTAPPQYPRVRPQQQQQFPRRKNRDKRWKLIKPVEQVEKELTLAVEWLQENKRSNSTTAKRRFPTIRECNAALAVLGDHQEFLRALRLFGKLRKAASLLSPKNNSLRPTLVTYSTLMSRFVKANKPAVALRLWKLREDNEDEAMDVKACNILMNCHAKRSDVASARALLHDMQQRPRIPFPNLITYNTFLSACQQAGDLDAALHCYREELIALRPDTRTFTTLIATVARRPTKAAGRYDPTLAFELYKDMKEQNVPANGKTFSALIDCCNRCKRSDLALQGLRLMLRHKQQQYDGASLPHEVGAWTAAIHGVASLELARKLFDTMIRCGVAPNTITCGSLTDRLLKAGKTEAAVDVLRYMKEERVGVSEVMVTSLLMHAQELVKTEQQSDRLPVASSGDEMEENTGIKSSNESEDTSKTDPPATKAIEIYTGLLESLLMDQNHHQSSPPAATQRRRKTNSHLQHPQNAKQLLVVKAFLLFQEIQSTGLHLDLGCYHTLLRVCARANDLAHAETVVRDMLLEDSVVLPTDTTWRLLLQAAGNDVASVERIWKETAMAYHRKKPKQRRDNASSSASPIISADDSAWTPSTDSFRLLLRVYAMNNQSETIVQLARAVKQGVDWQSFGTDRIDYTAVQHDVKIVQIVREAILRLKSKEVSRDQP